MTPGEICCKVCQLAMTDPCFADSPENLLSLLPRLILMTHTITVILPWSHWEVYLLTFLQRRGAVFFVEEGPSHPFRWGETAWILTEKKGNFPFILSRPFHFAKVLLLYQELFWLIRQIWSIGCLQIILFCLKHRYEGKLLILELYLESISAS
jgi:hypothetical protein